MLCKTFSPHTIDYKPLAVQMSKEAEVTCLGVRENKSSIVQREKCSKSLQSHVTVQLQVASI